MVRQSASKGDLCIICDYGGRWVKQAHRQCSLPFSLSRHAPVYFLDNGAEHKVNFAQETESFTVIKGLARQLHALRRRGLHQAAKAWSNYHFRSLRQKYQKIVFLTDMASSRFDRYIPHDFLVYDCIDPCFAEDAAAKQKHEQEEYQIISKSALVFATSDALEEKCKNHHPHVYLLNNACEPCELSLAAESDGGRPDWWPRNVSPVASYFGGINERVDIDLLEFVCVANPGVNIILAGHVLASLSMRLAKFSHLPNVIIPGTIPVKEMQYLLWRSTVSLIPFNLDEIGDAINPQKLYAHAFVGKPVVATATRELLKFKHLITIARSHEEFSQAVRLAISQRQPKQEAALREFARNSTWQVRAAEAFSQIKRLTLPVTA